MSSGGRRIGPYQILKKLGEGGIAKVYLARHDGASGIVTYRALKRMHAERAADPFFIQRMEREARVGALVQHHNVVRILDLLTVDESPVLVMEFVDGRSMATILTERIRSGQPIPLAVCLEIVASVLDGLAAIHATRDPEGGTHHFIHRDIKPGNVLVTAAGVVKVTDFGVAKADDGDPTTGGLVLGTMRYMAPEHLAGRHLDGRADIYSTGVMLLEMLSRKPAKPFEPGVGIDLSQLPPDTPDSVRRLVGWMVAYHPDDRPASARDAAAAVRSERARLPASPCLRDSAEALVSGSFDPQETWTAGPPHPSTEKLHAPSLPGIPPGATETWSPRSLPDLGPASLHSETTVPPRTPAPIPLEEDEEATLIVGGQRAPLPALSGSPRPARVASSTSSAGRLGPEGPETFDDDDLTLGQPVDDVVVDQTLLLADRTDRAAFDPSVLDAAPDPTAIDPRLATPKAIRRSERRLRKRKEEPVPEDTGDQRALIVALLAFGITVLLGLLVLLAMR